MKFIKHRLNTIEQIKANPKDWGAEIDLRTIGNKLVMEHDPFKDGEDFEEWIKHYNHGTLILNTKEDGLEERVLALLAKHNISDFFFLDTTIPTTYKWSQKGMKKMAVRYSEIESIESVLLMKDRVEWVWIDCFTHLPTKDVKMLNSLNLKKCLVSPELVRGNAEEIQEYKKIIQDSGMKLDAICTKRPELWE